jgi:quercetin dioxygenase-like cupin family protein
MCLSNSGKYPGIVCFFYKQISGKQEQGSLVLIRYLNKNLLSCTGNNTAKMKKPKEQASIQKLVPQAVRLADLIDYQKGSVVSRMVVNKKSGTVTLFAFDEGQGLSEHTAPFDALVQILDGEAKITISGKSLLAKKGEMVIMPANEPHALKAEKKFKMLLTMIRSES